MPFSWVYGLAVRMRNSFYRRGWFPSQPAELPTVIVGNISLGGTGKTPHTRWLVKQLDELQPAILSRGYGRSTRGFQWVQCERASTGAPAEVPQPHLHGDEPVMYAKSLPNTPVAVCEDRLEGVRRIASESKAKCVILDDALQHRRLKGNIELALMRLDQLPHKDHYLPAGNLRDHRSRLTEVDAIIITHCGVQSEEDIRKAIAPSLPPSCTAKVYISRTKYSALLQVNGDRIERPKHLIVVTGIAHTGRLIEQLQSQYKIIKHFQYPDHHSFKPSQVQDWKRLLTQSEAEAIVTTEKDFVRLQTLPSDLPVFVLPIEIDVENGAELIGFIREQIELR